MKIDVLLGLQWGDEGKGKVVDVITPDYDIIARFQGGPNAGHSLEINDIKHIVHNIPSGIFRKNALNIIGNGVVIDPVIFKKEIDSLSGLGVDLKGKLLISKKAHLILPTHRVLDEASEAAKGKDKIGSTLKGIGPAYMDKTGRNGLRVGNIIENDFSEKYNFLVNKHRNLLKQYDYSYDISEAENEWLRGIDTIRSFDLIDSEYFINKALKENKTILAEGAQGTMLDIDFGTYPFVTSSNTVCAGVCNGLGVSPDKTGKVFGISKAYCTRVGSGPFPTELYDETGEALRKHGHEFGATTGRPRRCGWLDLTALKYAIMLNGVTQLIITKTDVLDHFDTIKIATGYKIGNELVDQLPFEVSENLEPVYREFKGWKKDLSGITDYNDLPDETKDYIRFIEDETCIPVKMISVGPNRDQIIFR